MHLGITCCYLSFRADTAVPKKKEDILLSDFLLYKPMSFHTEPALKRWKMHFSSPYFHVIEPDDWWKMTGEVIIAFRCKRWRPTAWKHTQQILLLPPSSFFWFTCSFNWSSNGSQYRQKLLSSAESSPNCLVRWITSECLQCAVICPSMDRELLLAEIEIPLQPVEMSTVRLKEPLPWRQVPQKFKSQSFSLEAEGDKSRHTTIKDGFMFGFPLSVTKLFKMRIQSE